MLDANIKSQHNYEQFHKARLICLDAYDKIDRSRLDFHDAANASLRAIINKSLAVISATRLNLSVREVNEAVTELNKVLQLHVRGYK
ncbi:hypothetical protein ACVWU4_000997 [Campylobacter coli]